MNSERRKKRTLLLDFLRDYLIPPTCAGCGERLPILSDVPFCADCLLRWENEKRERCTRCGLTFLDCRCLTPLLIECGIRDGIFLSAYRAGGATVTDRLIYCMKSERDTKVFSFLARELSVPIRAYLRAEEIVRENVLLVPLPRRRRAVREHGFDQGKLLCASLSKAVGCEYKELLVRHRDGYEQKELNAQERLLNLKRAFRLKGSPDLSGKVVFLVDDVMTTGSGLLTGAELLLGCGADRIVPVTVARTTDSE